MIGALTDRLTMLCYFLIVFQIFNKIIIIIISSSIPEALVTLSNCLFQQCMSFTSSIFQPKLVLVFTYIGVCDPPSFPRITKYQGQVKEVSRLSAPTDITDNNVTASNSATTTFAASYTVTWRLFLVVIGGVVDGDGVVAGDGVGAGVVGGGGDGGCILGIMLLILEVLLQWLLVMNVPVDLVENQE